MQLLKLRNRRRRGLSLVEVMVVTALMASISAFTIVLYSAAMGDFEHANMKYSMHIYARRAMSKIENVLATAAARRPNMAIAEAFYWPETGDTTEQTYCDFITASNFIQSSATECAYAFDDGANSPAGYTALYRYRIAWTPTQLGNVPPKSVYMERLQDTAINSTPMTGLYRQVLSPNIGRCTFRRTLTGTIQVRMVVYAFDTDTGRGLDGQRMSSQTKRRRRDATSTATDTHEKSYELLTSIPISTLTIK